MNIEMWMKRNVISIQESATLLDAAEIFIKYHIGTLPVINSDGVMIGLILIRDLISLTMPDFIHLIEDFDFIPNFGVFEDRKIESETLSRLVRDVMEAPVSVEADSGLMRAAALLNKKTWLIFP